jgi:hypothetical protein
MWSFRLFVLGAALIGLIFGSLSQAWAVEEGEFVKRDGKWQYLSTEDHALKYLYQKNIITKEEYEKGAKAVEIRQRLLTPNFKVDVNNGLNFRVGDKFLLKVRLLTQVRYTYHTYNQAWGTIGDSKNMPELLGGQVEFRSVKQQSNASDFQVRRTRLQFLGYAFDPDLRYNISLAADQSELNQDGSSGTVRLLDAYLSSWHIPMATVQAGQQRVWFNRALITSIATTSFADNMYVQNAFAANTLNRRDIGILVLSDEDQYRFNYAFGIWNGTGLNLTREGTSVSQFPQGVGATPTRTYNWDTRLMTGELMYTVRLLYKISGNPGYGQGDILYSRTPQTAIAFGYAYDPGLNFLSSVRSDIVDRGLRAALVNNGNGRLLAGGIYDFQTYEVDFIGKYLGWSLQAEGYYRHQRVRSTNSQTIAFDPTTIPNGPQVALGQAWGFYTQVGKYVIPKKVEVAVRYGIMDPSTRQTHDLIKEFGVAINYSFDGTYNNRLILDYSNFTMGTGGAAPDRAPFDRLKGAGRDLIENRINVQYQFYF